MIDFYFSRKNSKKTRELQLFGIVCLIIANKFEDNVKLPLIFDDKELKKALAMEQDILLKLDFKINPHTYNDYGEGLLQLWIRFCKRMSIEEEFEDEFGLN